MGSYGKFVKRLSLVYLFYFILLSPIIVPNRGWLDMGFPDGLLVLVKDMLLRYTYPGSWFLSALVVSSGIVLVLLRMRLKSWLLLTVFFLFYLYLSNMDELPPAWYAPVAWYEVHVRNIGLSFPTALFWISIGACFSTTNIQNLMARFKRYAIGIWGLFFVFFILEFMKVELKGMWIALMVVCLIVLFFNMDLKPSPIYIRLREYSILFFFWHFIVLQVYKVVFHGQHILQFGAWLYPMTLVPVFFIATLILWLENKRYFKWLKYSH